MSSTDDLKRVLTDHIAGGTYFLAGLKSDTMLRTMMTNGLVKIYINETNGNIDYVFSAAFI